MSAAAELLAAGAFALRGRPSWRQWRQWLIEKVLYDTAVNRQAKARARIGLAIIAFATVYLIIAARLVMFALAYGKIKVDYKEQSKTGTTSSTGPVTLDVRSNVIS